MAPSSPAPPNYDDSELKFLESLQADLQGRGFDLKTGHLRLALASRAASRSEVFVSVPVLAFTVITAGLATAVSVDVQSAPSAIAAVATAFGAGFGFVGLALLAGRSRSLANAALTIEQAVSEDERTVRVSAAES